MQEVSQVSLDFVLGPHNHLHPIRGDSPVLLQFLFADSEGAIVCHRACSGAAFCVVFCWKGIA